MKKYWLKSYPKGIASDISVSTYNSLVHLFDTSVKKFNDLPALTNMGHTMTYGEVGQMVETLASFFQNHLKLQKGDRIAIQSPNVLQVPIAIFAAHKAGLVVVNTNPLYTPREMKHQFCDSGVKAILIVANFAHALEQILHQTSIQHIIVTEIGDLFPPPKRMVINFGAKYVKKMVPPYKLPGHYTMRQALALGTKQPFTPISVVEDDLAFLQYTGGTTGVSKGAMLTHRNIIANSEQITAWMKPKLIESKEVIITALPLYHIFSLTVNLFGFFKYGGHNILNTNPRYLKGLIRDMNSHPFTIMTGINTLFNSLAHNAKFQKVNFSHAKLSVAGGMALQKAVKQKWEDVTGTPIVEGYGLTETSPVVSCNPIDGHDKVGSIGLPLPSTEIRICNDQGEDVPLGKSGELWVKGPQVMKGYWNRPEETELVLTSDGWLKTGDIGIMDEDGFFRIVDRKKDMILVSGFNVYPNEIEDVIALHQGVAEVAAIGVPDRKSNEAVKVFIVPRVNSNLCREDILTHCRQYLTNYKIPKHIEFRTELPKSSVGKVLRRALKEEPTEQGARP